MKARVTITRKSEIIDDFNADVDERSNVYYVTFPRTVTFEADDTLSINYFWET